MDDAFHFSQRIGAGEAQFAAPVTSFQAGANQLGHADPRAKSFLAQAFV